MCGRFTLRTPQADLVEEFGVASLPLLTPRYNIAPTQAVLIVRWDSTTHARVAALARWGLVPSWADDPKIGQRMINARGETVAEKPSFRAAFRRRRCLVPADGYYEWQVTGGRKQPYLIHRRDGGPLAIAGLWESWTSPDGSPLESCTLITTSANDFTRPIHDRMPVILDRRDYDTWLANDTPSPALLDLIRPLSSSELTAYRVSTTVNSPANERPECVTPLDA